MANTIGKGKRMGGKMQKPQALPQAPHHSRREELLDRKIQEKRAKSALKKTDKAN